MAKHKWFFKRGNARLSWETLPEWVKWVAVDKTGKVFGYERKPGIKDGLLGFWGTVQQYIELAHTGSVCGDWQSLIFERPNEKPEIPFNTPLGWLLFSDIDTPIESCKYVPTLITPEEWAAIRLLLPGAKYVAKDKDGMVNAYTSCPYKATEFSWYVKEGHQMRVPALIPRFFHTPWEDSLVKYKRSEQ